MNSIKEFAKNIISKRWFEVSITIIILLNAFFIGVETYTTHPTITLLQHIILGISRWKSRCASSLPIV
ncbi:MAG: hypothetical protein IKH52_02990 [Bacteroidaceae bacterium]|nr:hypothetical protein [Bacteroidaceae bacterium]